MFVDKAKIYVKAGNGGDGRVSFRREKFVQNGGPDGGDGGDGGDVIFVATRNENTLSDFRHKKHYKAENGEPGGTNNCYGKSGKDLILKVPVGTIIREFESGKVMADLSEDGEQVTLVKGGSGGNGNQHYATARMQAPKYAQNGIEGKEYWITLELKLIADVGLIGFPNVGKSTILKSVTNAKPKIGNYHFTTLSPNLGVVDSKYGKSFVLADIPGIIEGASKGIGLGHEFLKHIERTKVLIHVVDGAGLDGRDPVEDIKKINNELKTYNEKLAELPQVIAINKIDLNMSDENVKKIRDEYEKEYKIFEISAATKKGIKELLGHVGTMLENAPDNVIKFESEFSEDELFRREKSNHFDIVEEKKGYFVVKGKSIEKMIGYTNLATEKGFAYLQKYLREHGILDALKEKGIKEGDTVKIYDVEFEYYK